MRKIISIACIACVALVWCGVSHAQGFPSSAALAGSAPAPPSGAVYTYLTGTCTGTSCTGAVTVCLSSNASTCSGTQVANTSIFYTLDGTPANEASTYYGPGGSAGEFTIPDPASGSRSIVVNAVLVQTKCTGTTCNGYTVSGCSSGCYAEIIQDGMNVKSWRKENVACTATGSSPSNLNCPSTVFTQTSTPISGGTQTGSATTPTVQHGTCTGSPSYGGNDMGVRGAPTAVWDYVSQSLPTVDLFSNTDTTTEHDIATSAGVDCGPSTKGTGDTEDLTPVQDGVSITPGGPTRGCDSCTTMAASFYTAHVFEGASPSGSTLYPANLSEEERDHNWGNGTLGSSGGNCFGSPSVCYGYGTSNIRCSMDHASPVTSGSNTYGQWEFSSQNGTNSGWAAFMKDFPSLSKAVTHDCDFPFGTLGAQTSSSTTVPSYTAGKTNTLYNGGENSYPLEPGILIVDAGTANAESEQLVGPPGAITGLVRGIGGTTPHAHAAGALASEFVKVQIHATSGAAGSTTCTVGTPGGYALYMDYAMFNGHYYGVPAYKALLGSAFTASPTIYVEDTWPTQNVGGVTRSVVCSYYGSGTSTANGWDQMQPYMKPGTGNPALTGIFDQHDNLTLSWGIVGNPSQTIVTQAH